MNAKVLYIVGTQRGGTTITGRVAGALPGFVYSGELRRLWARAGDADVRCGCGEVHAQCPVWSRVLPETLVGLAPAEVRAWQRVAAPDRGSARKLGWLLAGRGGEADAQFAAVTGRLYRAFATASGAHVVIDASKTPADAFVAARSGVDTYVLHLVRDPRGVAYSVARRAGAGAASATRAAVGA
ncbi:MAG TPA: hypothetical protein VHD87_10645, partial [Acidimicrobiales bacterium]|nr:hypothetical protein [Acidimicrobiales bacterium]